MKTGLLNIGNTHTEICNSDLGDYCKVKSSELLETASSWSSKFDSLVISSVVPVITQNLKSFLNGMSIHDLSCESVKNIDFSEVDKTTIGADRLANILGAQNKLGPDFLVIDCGTCITAELVSENVFKGGLIMPGRALQRKAINIYTGQLPEIPLSDSAASIGINTKSAISVGIDTISLKGLHLWITEILLEYKNIKIGFTGGDAGFFIENASFPFTEIPNLTLLGLKVFADSFEY